MAGCRECCQSLLDRRKRGGRRRRASPSVPWLGAKHFDETVERVDQARRSLDFVAEHRHSLVEVLDVDRHGELRSSLMTPLLANMP